ncbi:Putative uncharacterized protein OS=Streptomyces himastatinicus ATCC 53653 GN=SSOG_04500 PE=4 SV=1: HAD_2 [Gemmata massiliana]|uniref:Uncharacterized protein n=1 Tax=Gemmata massiliana TaxID=1210884 RepID=A0A6P2D1M8_9BACT|nr:HAD family hydrolase [Gemmata massiliana]VTR94014.1 Putative uncharacterized protein OS=Streptomyces himastatinicus ATCC 53653 GN=SSOG_04500 PE=4 SV=1: HAD_2 [Gemmata massiliana]
MDGAAAWLIFDADNTLWPIECLYDSARERFVRWVSAEGPDGALVEEYQRTRDKELHKTYGYSACRFARSFEDTLLCFLPDAPAEAVRFARQLALGVFEQPVQPVDGLETILDRVSREYQLAIITAGEQWVQERRLNSFQLRSRFAAIQIVEAKTAETFRSFCESRFIDPARSWVVGDSARSDMIPARDAGLGGIHVDHRENWALEQIEVVPWDRYVRIHTLAELVSVQNLLSACS